jgi:hypothetical protein
VEVNGERVARVEKPDEASAYLQQTGQHGVSKRHMLAIRFCQRSHTVPQHVQRRVDVEHFLLHPRLCLRLQLSLLGVQPCRRTLTTPQCSDRGRLGQAPFLRPRQVYQREGTLL